MMLEHLKHVFSVGYGHSFYVSQTSGTCAISFLMLHNGDDDNGDKLIIIK